MWAMRRTAPRCGSATRRVTCSSTVPYPAMTDTSTNPPPPGEYDWQVTAYNKDNQVIAGPVPRAGSPCRRSARPPATPWHRVASSWTTTSSEPGPLYSDDRQLHHAQHSCAQVER